MSVSHSTLIQNTRSKLCLRASTQIQVVLNSALESKTTGVHPSLCVPAYGQSDKGVATLSDVSCTENPSKGLEPRPLLRDVAAGNSCGTYSIF